MLAYRVPSTVTWGKLFTVMEALKGGRDPLNLNAETEVSPPCSLPIVEVYAASDTSLEQVFLSFARESAQQEVMSNNVSKVVTTMVTEL